MARRPCLDCPVIAQPGHARCPDHERKHQHDRNTRRTHYHGDWPRIAAQAVVAHRAQHGDWCPGWHRPPHPATDLTCDHVDPTTLTEGVRVLCRSCNARRGNNPD